MRLHDADPDIPSCYFIAIEHKMVVECRGILSSLFNLLAVHYVFNLEYHPKVKDILFFLQHKILGIDDPSKKSAMYSNVTAAIECFISHD